MQTIVKFGISVIWFLVFSKLFLFWLWLWQIKNYHIGRFRAHFERQKIKKLLTSFYRMKVPVFTKKVFIISGLWFLALIAFFIFIYQQNDNNFRLFILLLLFFLPLVASAFILFFQIPTYFWQVYILHKAGKKREQFKNLIVIGITGSYGKTSVKEFLAAILEKKYNVLKTKEHTNAEVGIAQTILHKLKPEHQVFVAEIGAYEKGKIRQVCQILKPKIGILTGINEQHLATFSSQENIIKAKFELIEALPEDGVAIFNGDNEDIMSNVKCQMSKLNVKCQIFCSTGEKMDIWAENIKASKGDISFEAYSRDEDSAEFILNSIGQQNIINILLAAACAKELGMNLSEISSACRKFKQDNLKKGVNGLNILDYTYSANPASVMAHLQYLERVWRNQNQTRKIIMVMPCLIELGRAAKKVHQDIGREIAKVCDLAIITNSDFFKELRQGASQAGGAEKMVLIEQPVKIFEKIVSTVQKDDIILLESRVPKDIMRLLNCEL